MMADAAPSLFRTLEKPRGAASLDMVVQAASTAYASLERPEQQQTADIAQLILSGWPQMSAGARKAVAERLHANQDLPTEVHRLLSDTCSHEARPAPPSPMLGLVRQTLQRIADTRQQTCPACAPVVQAVADAAIRRNSGAAYTLLAKAYGLSPSQQQRLSSDPDGKATSIALKGLHTPQGDALGILIALYPGIAADLTALDKLGAFYRGLNADNCRHLLNERLGQPDGPGFGRLKHPSADSAPRTHFGKRLVRPDARKVIPQQA